MSQHDRIDPESLEPLTALLEFLPGGFNAIPDIDARRATLYGMLEAMTKDLPPNENVAKEDRTIPGPAGDLAIRIYRPVNATGTLPGIYFIHGGGMVLGNLDSDDGVPTEFHLYPGAYHASEIFAPTAALSGRIWAARLEALKAALA